MTTAKKAKTAKPKKATGRKRQPTFGEQLLAAMDSLGDPAELAKAVITGKVPPGATYRISRLEIPTPTFPAPDLTPADVADTRTALGLSQAAFAAFLGVAPGSVRAWEDGRTPLPGIATRFLAEVRADPAYWKARVAAAG